MRCDRRGAWCVAFCCALTLVAFATGFVVVQHRVFPYSVLHRLEQPLVDYVRARLDGREARLRWVWDDIAGPVDIETTLIGLHSRRVPVPVGDHAAGGALARVGDALLLVTGAGEIFAVSPEGARKTAIVVPDNHASAFAELAGDESYRRYNLRRLDFYQPRYHDLLHFQQGGRQGLLLSYTEWDSAGNCYANVLARLDLPATVDPLRVAAGPGEWVRLFTTKPCLPLLPAGPALPGHVSGGRMALAGAGKVLLSVGYFGQPAADPARAISQRLDNDYGKLLTIDIGTGARTIISAGHRNPQGVLVDAAGAVWSTEHGPHGGDELNRIYSGGNYGWPVATLGVDPYVPVRPPDTRLGRHEAFIAPVYAWLPSVGVSNLVQLKGFHPAWDGDFLVATLAAKKLFRLRVQQDRVILAETVDVGVKGRDLQQYRDGSLALWSDDADAVIFYTPVSLEERFRRH